MWRMNEGLCEREQQRQNTYILRYSREIGDHVCHLIAELLCIETMQSVRVSGLG